jgi:cell division protein ZapE
MSARHPLPQDFLGAFSSAFARRGITPDAAQISAARRLQLLYEQLMAFKRARRTKLRKLLVHPPIPRGIFLWGGVGRGKSLLMDFFFEALPYRRKRRVHFHAFMREVHESLRRLGDEPDPLVKVAARIERETRFLCFDEFHVSDIADAMILGRLLEQLFARGVVFMMTSNYPPDGLYPNGLQRHNFLPTIALLKRHLDVIEVDSGVDYRLRTLDRIETYLVPADAAAESSLGQDFEALAGGAGHDRPIVLMGRELTVRRRAPGVIWFDFATLCGGPRSQNDYLELVHHYHTLLLSGVPRMGPAQAAEARRFTWLVDILYDHKVKLIASAHCAAEELYRAGPNAQEFPRTVSRLIEMRSREYLHAEHRADTEGDRAIAEAASGPA